MFAKAFACFFKRALCVCLTGKLFFGHSLENCNELLLLFQQGCLEFIASMITPENKKATRYRVIGCSSELLYVVGLQRILVGIPI
ncbi:MAG: hypothetical protein BWX50_01599 [Euryarchaeota archaeon ADurb.Bin009]|nr:MAG: hypothetical protein BWX50_01599 [Euryarchaeota archaeon ADurb.Bin009]